MASLARDHDHEKGTQHAEGPMPKKRRGLMIGLAIVGVIVLLAIVGAVMCGDEDEGTPVADTAPITTTQPDIPVRRRPATTAGNGTPFRRDLHRVTGGSPADLSDRPPMRRSLPRL